MLRKKPNFNFSLPEPVADAFDEVALRFGPKKRWTVCSTAILMFLELPRHLQEAYVKRMFAADLIPGEMQKIVKAAVSRSRLADRERKRDQSGK